MTIVIWVNVICVVYVCCCILMYYRDLYRYYNKIAPGAVLALYSKTGSLKFMVLKVDETRVCVLYSDGSSDCSSLGHLARMLKEGRLTLWE